MSQSVERHATEHGEGIHLPAPSITPMFFGLGFMLIAFGLINSAWKLGGVPAGLVLAGVGLAGVLGAVGFWLAGNIKERAVHAGEAPIEVAKFAMWSFLGTEGVIFGALIVNVYHLWQADHTLNDLLSKSLSSLILVSVNTFILLVSSLMVVLALDAIQQGNKGKLTLFLGLTALLGAAFVGIQGYEYAHLMEEGLQLGGSQYGGAFYFLTGNHGLHVIAGVIWALILMLQAARGKFTQGEHMAIEVFGLYWHFVDVIWILIFTIVYLF
jgi:cytochrome c oxidase subunit 3/cytochrome o ubiquinol oxidase subunit 3